MNLVWSTATLVSHVIEAFKALAKRQLRAHVWKQSSFKRRIVLFERTEENFGSKIDIFKGDVEAVPLMFMWGYVDKFLTLLSHIIYLFQP